MQKIKRMTVKVKKSRWKHVLWGMLIALVFSSAFSFLESGRILETWEMRSYDARMSTVRSIFKKPQGENVALLYVDEPSLATMKDMGISWPWPRELYASAIDFCRRGGAKAVVFDLFFSEDSTYGVADDQAFFSGLSAGIPTYFVVFLSKEEGALPPFELAKKAVVRFENAPAGLPVARSIQSQPLPGIIENASGFGNARTDSDIDGIYRRAPLALRIGDEVFPQLAVKVVADIDKKSGLKWLSRSGALFGGDMVPLDADGNLIINYIGGVGSYPEYPLAKVLMSAQKMAEGKEPDLDPAVLKDRIVIIGVAAPGLYDLKPTPLSHMYPGPEIHATMIDNLIRGDFMTPIFGATSFIMIFAISLVAGIGLSHFDKFTLIVSYTVGLVAAYLAIAWALFAANIWVPLVAPLASFFTTSFTVMLKNYLTEGRKKQAIKRAFGQYLSPHVVAEIAKDPDDVKMGGETTEITVFFSDIADFTTISEKMAPHELVVELNDYLSLMSGIIMEHEGTLDKYIGDAVMAFWGAPLKIESHAAMGMLAALKMQEGLRDVPKFKTRMGLHTGRAVVGNIGSNVRFNYTAIGDTINLASRLEGLNKKFGTYIIASESTYNEAREQVFARLIGKVRVKGRIEPIGIYEPLGPVDCVGAAEKEYVFRFEEAVRSFIEGDPVGARTKFAGLKDDDPVVAYYIKICDEAAGKAAGDFDGVISFTTK